MVEYGLVLSVPSDGLAQGIDGLSQDVCRDPRGHQGVAQLGKKATLLHCSLTGCGYLRKRKQLTQLNCAFFKVRILEGLANLSVIGR